MAIDHQIDEEVDQLVFSAIRLFDRAEKLLSDRYDMAKTQDDHVNLEYTLQKLAFLYSLKKDFASAERAYAQWERESQDPTLAKSEAAFFFFNLLANFKKALAKAQEIEKAVEPKLIAQLASPIEIHSLFRALHISGRSLLKLGRTNEVNDTVKRINTLLQQNSDIQFGFELDLVEECLDANLALDECAIYLDRAHWSSYDSDEFEPRKDRALKRLHALRK